MSRRRERRGARSGPARGSPGSGINRHDPIRSRVKIQYPFHPHYDIELAVVHRPHRAEAPITVVAPDGTHLKVPAWMLSRGAARHSISTEAAVDPDALLELAELLRTALERVRAEG